MTAPIRPEVLVGQADALAGDLRELTPGYRSAVDALPDAVWHGVQRVVLTGSGDSHHAACGAELAFEAIADVDCDPAPSLRFLEYGAESVRRRRTLVVAVSASGGTEQVLRSVRRATELGASTIAVTGSADSPLAEAADHAVIVGLPHREPSPGIRTHQASLLGLLLIALRLAECRGAAVETAHAELLAAADAVAAAAEAARGCDDLADAVEGVPALVVAGSGPAWGAAQYAAAKLVEGAGIPAFGQDVEEWCHVERFTRPADAPVIVLAPAGRAHWRAVGMAEKAKSMGRTVIAVADPTDTEMKAHADLLIPLPTAVREDYAALTCAAFAPYLAARLATRLGRAPFLRTPESS
ncbi:Glucosamine-6-phosphate deaminase [isomerizing], alternative [Alloactinosynnema sp. L-07]|uniref:SIS domain-containing protein n=1 Tax=Alloactinosynnema sp. L-07 TaxID=1653480 RepID=UPI00065F02C9|nr:SIS domain-containing protein [Alloactinosynnema sp. L-07]CRK61874.1 Glucosamine-6-phosphate deaminase [isomerizing], alternative [Alloactinosynnema sp. L-07]